MSLPVIKNGADYSAYKRKLPEEQQVILDGIMGEHARKMDKLDFQMIVNVYENIFKPVMNKMTTVTSSPPVAPKLAALGKPLVQRVHPVPRKVSTPIAEKVNELAPKLGGIPKELSDEDLQLQRAIEWSMPKVERKEQEKKDPETMLNHNTPAFVPQMDDMERAIAESRATHQQHVQQLREEKERAYAIQDSRKTVQIDVFGQDTPQVPSPVNMAGEAARKRALAAKHQQQSDKFAVKANMGRTTIKLDVFGN